MTERLAQQSTGPDPRILEGARDILGNITDKAGGRTPERAPVAVVCHAIHTERDHQRRIWHDDAYHDVATWQTIIAERVGKLATVCLAPSDSPHNHRPARLSATEAARIYRRTVELAAVAFAFAEQLVTVATFHNDGRVPPPPPPRSAPEPGE